ncbi:hypothetical protein F3Y22_tig00112738pilonHSYRG00557 [Hibiscus syriacus]|uniref:Uncharacterized protein n=1 Tax=Hibiscus syriacus TaxID=106335 RepID=A0A6A2Y6N9_HIBSY|nr:uncharacterized protein LOC120182930 [Hibiscus syriacus]KAE8664824.1 hypothetical protein F3Y22_tig00112738pilonHSYRG00557 [Hibiscus syriacus]
MGRQGGGDPTVVSSSIVLLQERFRQLQKDRERREGKELLKLLSESDMRFEPNGSAEAARQKPHQDSSLSLGLSSHGRRTNFRAVEIQASSTSLWPNETSSTSKKFETCDVDTSLHL